VSTGGAFGAFRASGRAATFENPATTVRCPTPFVGLAPAVRAVTTDAPNDPRGAAARRRSAMSDSRGVFARNLSRAARRGPAGGPALADVGSGEGVSESADTTPYPVSRAVPMPRATANPPTRPTYRAAPTWSSEPG